MFHYNSNVFSVVHLWCVQSFYLTTGNRKPGVRQKINTTIYSLIDSWTKYWYFNYKMHTLILFFIIIIIIFAVLIWYHCHNVGSKNIMVLLEGSFVKTKKQELKKTTQYEHLKSTFQLKPATHTGKMNTYWKNIQPTQWCCPPGCFGQRHQAPRGAPAQLTATVHCKRRTELFSLTYTNASILLTSNTQAHTWNSCQR